MNWLSNFIRPKIRSFVGQKEVPDNLWQKCPSCEGMLFYRDLENNLNVCHHCDFHLAIDVFKRLELLFDQGDYERADIPKVQYDPLKFRDRKRYTDRIKENQGKTGEQDAIVVAHGKVGGQPTVIAAFNFAFMGGSMGAAVGEGIVRAAEVAVEKKAALITIPASGGARMQEGMISLMQMPRTIIAVEMVKEAGLPYLVVLTNPTTGGVSASFAMLGDVHIAEPGATIGFAGKRVIEETIREQLPENFQTAEYLLDHGMVDIVASRQDMHGCVARILNTLMQPVKDSSGGSPLDEDKAEIRQQTELKKGETTPTSGGGESRARPNKSKGRSPAHSIQEEADRARKAMIAVANANSAARMRAEQNAGKTLLRSPANLDVSDEGVPNKDSKVIKRK